MIKYFSIIAPFLTVYIWSTGFILAKFVGPNADPNIFLSIRFFSSACIFAILSFFLGSNQKPSLSQFFKIFGIGVLVHGIYLSSLYFTIGEGFPAGIASLMGAFQPPLTALLAAKFDGEKHSHYLIVGLIIGVIGVSFAVMPMLMAQEIGVVMESTHLIIVTAFAILSLTLGVYLQKRFVANDNFYRNNAIQYFGGFSVTACMMLILQEQYINFNDELIFAIFYGVFLSIAGFSLLLYLIRLGNLTKVTSLFFIVPPFSAIQAYYFFDENLSYWQIAGFFVAILGVYMTNKKSKIPLSPS